MTLMVHELFEVHGGEQWKAWGLDLFDHGDFLGEVSVRDYYFPPRWLEEDAACEVITVEGAFWIAEMPHATLMRVTGPNIHIVGSPGDHGRGRLVDTRIRDLDPAKRYAVTWLEVY